MYREDTPNLPRSLKAAGYRTGMWASCMLILSPLSPLISTRLTDANFDRKQSDSDYAKHAGEFHQCWRQPFFLSVNYPDAHDPWIRQVDGLPKSTANTVAT